MATEIIFVDCAGLMKPEPHPMCLSSRPAPMIPSLLFAYVLF